MPFHDQDDDISWFAIAISIMFVLWVVIIGVIKIVSSFL